MVIEFVSLLSIDFETNSSSSNRTWYEVLDNMEFYPKTSLSFFRLGLMSLDIIHEILFQN